MKIAHDVKLLQLIKVIPPILVLAFAIMAITIVINNNQETLQTDINALEEDFVSSRKNLVEAQVKQVIQQIEFEKSNTESILKETIKQNIYQAHAIASGIYEENLDKSEAEVVELIKSALRDIRFNNGRGYFFIYKTSGESILHPILPAMEGSQKIGLQDVRGNYIVKDMGELAKQHGETFYTWWFVKPNNQQREFKKIGFGKLFAPYDWFIGTGEYVVDVESDIQKELIKSISNIRYGDSGYAFLYDFQGNVLSHIDEDFKNTNLFEHSDPAISSVGGKIIEIAKNGGGFLSYTNVLTPSAKQTTLKTSYVMGVPEWNWVLGMGFYQSEIEQQLRIREDEISQQNKQQLIELLSLSSLVTFFFIILSLFLTKNLSKRFAAYEDKINKDFNELNKLKLESQYQAMHDALTGLPNRLLLEEQLSQGIALSKKNEKLLAVIFVDLDDFKKINDLHGHSIGDGLLKVLGKHFKDVIEDGDSVARFGGDEFIFCFPELDRLLDAENKVKKILSIFKQQFDIDTKSIYSSCSIGVAMYPKDGSDTEDLISKADAALYKSKSIQKGQSLFFNSNIDAQVKRDFLIESELRTALDNNEISLHYQPQFSVNKQEVVGVEALIRWNSKKLGFVSPAEFIPLAEHTSTINDLGNFVLKQSMLEIKQFNARSERPINLSINISPKQLLEPNFVNRVVKTSEETKFSPEYITLEITENTLITDLSVVKPILEELRHQGFKLALDDFGTGYSSLNYLSNLPMNEIKIDRTFIDKFLTNSQSESLVKTIIAIGSFSDLTVVAEGVETQEQFERLAEFKCDFIQGYYFEKPLSFDDFSAKYQTSLISIN